MVQGNGLRHIVTVNENRYLINDAPITLDKLFDPDRIFGTNFLFEISKMGCNMQSYNYSNLYGSGIPSIKDGFNNDIKVVGKITTYHLNQDPSPPIFSKGVVLSLVGVNKTYTLKILTEALEEITVTTHFDGSIKMYEIIAKMKNK